jgi:hypothetical protein
VSIVQQKINAKFLFAATQSIIALSALTLAAMLNFNFFNTQLSLSIPNDALNFYIVMFIIFGITFLISGLFLIYEWWENQ